MRKRGFSEGVKIVALCVLGAVLYGETQDHSLILYCPEYFTRMHSDIFGTEDVRLLALGWGFVATWWVGLLLGSLLCACARGGELPKLRWRSVLPGVALIFLSTGAVTAATFLVAQSTGFLARYELLVPVEDLSSAVQQRASTMLAAYNASYFTAFAGGVAASMWTVSRRRRMARGAVPMNL